MAGGRWYPSLLPLGDGRVLAVAGLDGTSQLNVVPEIYTDGVGWAARPASQHWPMYAHLFLLDDGRVFYSGGQYGDNNGVKAAIWDVATNTTTDVLGLPVRRHAQPVGQRAAATRAGPAGDDHRRRRRTTCTTRRARPARRPSPT